MFSEKRLEHIVELFDSLSLDFVENFVCSPVAVNSMLRVLLEGAKSQTAISLEDLLLLFESNPRYIFENDMYTDENLVLLKNYLITHPDIDIFSSYVEDLRVLGIDVFHDKFSEESLNSQIDDIVKRETFGLMDSLSVNVPKDAQSFLFSTLYFQRAWKSPLVCNDSKSMYFNSGGKMMEVQMMDGFAEYYFDTSEYIGFIKKYADDCHAFMCLLPKSIHKVSAPSGNDIYSALLLRQQNGANITLPKFSVQSAVSARRTLEQDFELKNVFAGNTNFRNMSYSPLAISDAVLKSKLVVSEEGIDMDSIPGPPSKNLISERILVDRPFWFVILDIKDEEPIMIGRIINPKTEELKLPMP